MSDEIDDLYGGKYLGAASFNGETRRMKISAVSAEDLCEKDGTVKRKFVMHFEGEERALPLNKTNVLRCAQAFGRDRKLWVNKYVDAYTEMTGIGKMGIRLRPLQQKPHVPPVQPDDELDDTIPL